MSDFKLCENGHYFPQGLHECPYCPKTGSNIQQGGGLDKTILDLGGSNNFNQQNPNQILSSSSNDLSRTQIFTGGQNYDFGTSNQVNQFQPSQQSYGRKLVGWLVSFTIDPNGSDFKLYEGRNSIGSDYGCDIVVPNDAAISSKHLTILHRMGHFKFKDELSTNGTFINDVFEEEGNLKDGDMIRMGDTIFKFRSIA